MNPDQPPSLQPRHATARNPERATDVQNARGREISRNMTSLLGYIQQLEGMYDTMDDDPEITELLGKAAR